MYASALVLTLVAAVGRAPLVVGHRGAGATGFLNPLPENTLPSIRQAFAEGADLVEIDVQLDARGRVILWHDKYVTLAGQRRVVRQLPREALPQQAGASGLTAPVPTLEEALETALACGCGCQVLDVELKVHHDCDRGELVAAVAGVVERYQAVDRVLFTSSDVAALRALKARLGCCQTGLIVFLPSAAHAALASGRAAQAGLDWLIVNDLGSAAGTTRRLVALAHRHGVRLGVWTVDRPPRIERLARDGVDLIISNHPAAARAVLR